jgi:hypothetical protein
LQLAPDIVARNAGKNFYPAKEEMYSQWLLDEAGTQTFVRYYSPNNPQEAAARQAFMAHYGDPYQGLMAFATELAATLRESRPFRLPTGAAIEPVDDTAIDPQKNFHQGLATAYQEQSNDPEFQAEVERWENTVEDGLTLLPAGHRVGQKILG